MSHPFPLRAVVVGAFLALASAAAPAQDVLVSLSSDGAVGGQAVRDQDLLHHASGGVARVAWPSETLALFAGDLSGNGVAEVFGDVDALHDAGPDGGPTALGGLHLSLLSNQDGFLDGDVLRAGPGGFTVRWPESHFVGLVGASDGEIDVDAVHVDDDGSLLFSLAENEDSTLLSGDAAGVVADGAILSWSPGDAAATILFTESEVDGLVSAALGAATSIGDVKGLARDPGNGAVLFSVQSPSAHDASVFTTAGGGTLWSGHEEADFGYEGAAEHDALTIARSAFPSLTVSSSRPQADETLVVTLQGAQPGQAWILLAALGVEDTPSLGLDGWGGLVLAPDALFATMLAAAGNLVMLPDGAGAATFADALGPSVPAIDVVLQAVSPAPTLSSTNPVLIELGQ